MATGNVVFIDYDGTLVDSLDQLYGIYLRFLDQYRIKGTREEFDEINGPTLREFLKILCERYKITESIDDICARYLEDIEELFLSGEELPFDGVKAFLNYAKEKGLRLCIVTSSPEMRVQVFLQKQGWEHVFEEIVSGEAVANGKPHPDVYLKALEVMKCQADEAVAIEDSAHGLQSALSAGVPVIAFQSKEVEGCMAYAENWGEVKQLLEEMYV